MTRVLTEQDALADLHGLPRPSDLTPPPLVERLRTDVLWHQRRGNDTIAQDCQDAADELVRLTAERDALRADAERYRWLRRVIVTGATGDLLDSTVDAGRVRADAARSKT